MVSGWRWDERPERLPSWTYLMVAAARGVHEEVVGGGGHTSAGAVKGWEGGGRRPREQ